MPRDALDPGPNGNYPAFPRGPDGRPVFKKCGWPAGPTAESAGTGQAPSGRTRRRIPAARRAPGDLTLRDQEGRPVVPPPSG